MGAEPAARTFQVRREGGVARALPLFASLALGVLPIAIMMVGGGVFGMEKPAWWSWFPQACFGAASALGLLSFVQRRAALVTTSVAADAGGLTLSAPSGRRSRVARADIRGGVLAPRGEGHTARLELRGGRSLSFETASLAEAEQLLADAGVEPERARFEPALAPGPARALTGCGTAMALTALGAALKANGLLGVGMGLVWLVTGVAALAAWFFATRPARVAVGADGVTVRARGERFVPYGELAAVRARRDDGPRAGAEGGGSLELVGAGGEIVRVPVLDGPTLDALVARVRLGMAAAAREPEAAARRALLARDGRSLEAWRRALAEATRTSHAYRGQALPPDEAQRLLASANLSREERVGAALALRTADDAGAPARIRVAAEACADPRVRVALEAVAEGDDEGLEEALAAEAPGA